MGSYPERLMMCVKTGQSPALARQGKAWGLTPYGWDRNNGEQIVNEHEAADGQ